MSATRLLVSYTSFTLQPSTTIPQLNPGEADKTKPEFDIAPDVKEVSYT